MKPWAPASVAARSMSCTEASGRPKANVLAMLALNKVGCCGTVLMASRNALSESSESSDGPTLIIPLSTGLKRNMSSNSVDFPAPLLPTIAVVWPGKNSQFRPCRMGWSDDLDSESERLKTGWAGLWGTSLFHGPWRGQVKTRPSVQLRRRRWTSLITSASVAAPIATSSA